MSLLEETILAIAAPAEFADFMARQTADETDGAEVQARVAANQAGEA